MFTGIVTHTGTVERITPRPDGSRFSIISEPISGELTIGDSVAVNGVCLTVEKILGSTFDLFVSVETIARTTFGNVKQGDIVNLELPLRLSDRLGGHIVQGHVDCTGIIVRIQRKGESSLWTFSYSGDYSHLLVEKGSIAVDGISLTIVERTENTFSVSFIPHTIDSTTFRYRKEGDSVNIEFDLLGKYVAHLLHTAYVPRTTPISKDFLKQTGFIE